MPLVANHPGEDLEGGGDRADSGGSAGERPYLRGRPGGKQAPGGAREQERPQDVRAAALVLLRTVGAVLVGADRDVLGSVVLGEGRAAQGHRGRADGEEGGDSL